MMNARWILPICPLSLGLMVIPILSASAQERAAAPPEPARFHHVHLNVVDPEATMRFYERVFGAIRVKHGGVADALFTERSFILMNRVASPAPSDLKTGLWHIGWGGVDVANEYEWWRSQGVDIAVPLYTLGRTEITYFHGPDRELIELNTMGHHRFAHVHMFAEDVNATVQWYVDRLGLQTRRRDVPKPPDMTAVRAWSNSFNSDNVNLIVYGRPDFEPAPPWWTGDAPLTEFASTRGRVIDHLAFSYRDIAPVYERLRAEGVEIVEPIAMREEFNLKSFFVMAPDRVLIEIVEARPIPDAAWDK
jgi:catechol 2,3-dioxygenase-like lactoylglutathione lyase family enzyme